MPKNTVNDIFCSHLWHILYKKRHLRGAHFVVFLGQKETKVLRGIINTSIHEHTGIVTEA